LDDQEVSANQVVVSSSQRGSDDTVMMVPSRWAPTLMTLDDLNGRNVTIAEIKKLYGAHQKKLNDDRPILLAAKCRPMIIVSRNTLKCEYSRGFLGKGVSNAISVMSIRPNFEQEHVLINRHCALACC